MLSAALSAVDLLKLLALGVALEVLLGEHVAPVLQRLTDHGRDAQVIEGGLAAPDAVHQLNPEAPRRTHNLKATC